VIKVVRLIRKSFNSVSSERQLCANYFALYKAIVCNSPFRSNAYLCCQINGYVFIDLLGRISHIHGNWIRALFRGAFLFGSGANSFAKADKQKRPIPRSGIKALGTEPLLITAGDRQAPEVISSG
jgi:hypothetical protein